MASNTKSDIKKVLAARQTKVQIDDLKFRLKQKDQKNEKMGVELNQLRVENQKLKSENEKLKVKIKELES